METSGHEINTLIDDNWSALSEDLGKLTPKARVEAILKLMEFALPRLNRVSIDSGPGVDELLQMTKEERWNRIQELRKKIDDNDR